MASVAIMHLTVAVASLTARGNIQTHTESEREIECMSGHCRFADTNERMHAMKY